MVSAGSVARARSTAPSSIAPAGAGARARSTGPPPSRARCRRGRGPYVTRRRTCAQRGVSSSLWLSDGERVVQGDRCQGEEGEAANHRVPSSWRRSRRRRWRSSGAGCAGARALPGACAGCSSRTCRAPPVSSAASAGSSPSRAGALPAAAAGTDGSALDPLASLRRQALEALVGLLQLPPARLGQLVPAPEVLHDLTLLLGRQCRKRWRFSRALCARRARARATGGSSRSPAGAPRAACCASARGCARPRRARRGSERLEAGAPPGPGPTRHRATGPVTIAISTSAASARRLSSALLDRRRNRRWWRGRRRGVGAPAVHRVGRWNAGGAAGVPGGRRAAAVGVSSSMRKSSIMRSRSNRLIRRMKSRSRASGWVRISRSRSICASGVSSGAASPRAPSGRPRSRACPRAPTALSGSRSDPSWPITSRSSSRSRRSTTRYCCSNGRRAPSTVSSSVARSVRRQVGRLQREQQDDGRQRGAQRRPRPHPPSARAPRHLRAQLGLVAPPVDMGRRRPTGGEGGKHGAALVDGAAAGVARLEMGGDARPLVRRERPAQIRDDVFVHMHGVNPARSSCAARSLPGAGGHAPSPPSTAALAAISLVDCSSCTCNRSAARCWWREADPPPPQLRHQPFPAQRVGRIDHRCGLSLEHATRNRRRARRRTTCRRLPAAPAVVQTQIDEHAIEPGREARLRGSSPPSDRRAGRLPARVSARPPRPATWTTPAGTRGPGTARRGGRTPPRPLRDAPAQHLIRDLLIQRESRRAPSYRLGAGRRKTSYEPFRSRRSSRRSGADRGRRQRRSRWSSRSSRRSP